MNSEPNDGTGPHHSQSEVKQWFRAWRYLFYLLGLIAVVLVFYGEEDWRGYYAWQQYKEQTTAHGGRIEAESFIPPPVPDEENFAMSPVLAPLFDFEPGTQHWRDTNAPRAFQPLTSRFEAAANLVKQPSVPRANTWVRPATDLDAWAWAFAQAPNTKPKEPTAIAASHTSSPESAAAVLNALADFSPALDQLRAASQRPYSRFNLQYQEENPATILLPHLARLKYLCQILQLRASAELALDRTDDAQADLLLMLKVVDATKSEPILISQLVRISEFQMFLQPLAEGMGKWSEPQLKSIQQRLQTCDFLQDLNHALAAERVLFGGGVIEYVRRSPKKLSVTELFEGSDNNEGQGLWSMGPFLAAAPQGWFYLEELNYSRLFEQYLLPMIDVTNHVVKPSEARRSGEALAAKIGGPPASRLLHHNFFASMLLPGVSKFSEKAAFGQTAVDVAVIACALERYRIAHAKFPDSLSELVPQLLPALPHDVINGQPFAYKLDRDGGYILYSVGWNERDDRGTIKQTKSGGVEQSEGDWVWSNSF